MSIILKESVPITKFSPGTNLMFQPERGMLPSKSVFSIKTINFPGNKVISDLS